MKYIDHIKELPFRDNYSREELLNKKFQIAEEGNIQLFYAPFEYINTDAKVIIVGITPGWQQMEISHRVARKYLHDGHNCDDVFKLVKTEASFAGEMRTNLITYLDDLQLNKKLKIESSRLLFEKNTSYLHSTSMIKYPAMKNLDNYKGSSPAPHRSKVLWDLVLNEFVSEMSNFENRLIIPLGKSVKNVVKRLQNENLLHNNIILEDFPHPSGANGHRHKQFREYRDKMQSQIENWNY